MTTVHLVPADISGLYEVHEWRNATAVFKEANHAEWDDVMAVLHDFRLKRSAILKAGGRKSTISDALDKPLYERGWKEQGASGAETLIRPDVRWRGGSDAAGDAGQAEKGAARRATGPGGV